MNQKIPLKVVFFDSFTTNLNIYNNRDYTEVILI